MSYRRRFVTVRWLVLGAALACNVPAAAQAQDRSTPLSNVLTGEAYSAYESGRLLYKDGDNAGALAKFSRAYELSRDARLLWNMGACEKELRHYARATTLIARYLKEGAGKLSADNLASAAETQKALRAFYSIVTLQQAPEGARVFVDGASVGTVPLAEPLALDLGPRTLRVELAGYEPFETKINVPGSTDLAVDVALKPAKQAASRLVVDTAEGDTVLVDDKAVGNGRWEGPLSPGRHSVKVTREGKQSYESVVQLGAGETSTVSVVLASDERGAPLWPWIAGGVVVLGGAAVGGYFLFRPKTEAEPPVGKLGTVVLPGSMRW